MDTAQEIDAIALREGYSSRQRILQLAGITVFFGWTPYILLRCLALTEPLGITQALFATTMGVVAGYLFADASSGVVHWLGDNYGREDWPVIGPAFIRPFRHHHILPKDICEHGFVQLNGNNCLVTLPMFWIATLPSTDPSQAFQSCLFGFFCISLCWFVFATNQLHAWAHSDTPPKWVRWLQNTGLALSPKHHELHHAPPHNRAYCITSGVMDKPLQLIRFFPALEWVLQKLTGAPPVHHSAAVDPFSEATTPDSNQSKTT